MVEVISSSLLVCLLSLKNFIPHNGALSYTGDAILAFWKCSYADEDSSTHTVSTVVEKCLFIQQQHDNYYVGEDVKLRMKLAVSVGDVFIYHLGMVFHVCIQVCVLLAFVYAQNGCMCGIG